MQLELATGQAIGYRALDVRALSYLQLTGGQLGLSESVDHKQQPILYLDNGNIFIGLHDI